MAVHYPVERCLTLYNYLDASWKVADPGERFNEECYQEICLKASELMGLSSDPTIVNEARAQMQQLETLKLKIAT